MTTEDMPASPAEGAETSYAPELMIGVVAPTGIDADLALRLMKERLAFYRYSLEEIRLSDWLANLADVAEDAPTHLRVPALQHAGDLVRSCSKHLDAMALLGIREIVDARARLNKTQEGPVARRAYVIWSLKEKDEVTLLRQVFRSRFFVFSIYDPIESRRKRLAQKIKTGRQVSTEYSEFLTEADGMIKVDEHETQEFGQDVRNAYPEADFFINGSTKPALEKSIKRSIDIIFGAPYATPTKDEYGMYIAHAAGLRSAELGRQVGAAIGTQLGDIVATGTNEVPLFGGGHFWTDGASPERDNREYLRGADTSDETKRLLASEILSALKIDVEPEKESRTQAVYGALAKTGLADITEFGRAVHGEMSALMDACRRGVSVSGLTMYVTTFPCHQCTRHLVAAGIKRLVYVYPYAKSRAEELHGDSISTTALSILDDNHLCYENYLGVAPRLYPFAFTVGKRKDDQTDKALPIEDPGRVPKLPDEGPNGILDVVDYLDRETKAQVTSKVLLDKIAAEVAEMIRKERESTNGRSAGSGSTR